MAKYKVTAQISYLLDCEIEANSYEEARDKANQLDGGDFKEVDGTSLWDIDSIEEVTNGRD
jgi:hypothetical protein